MTQYRILKLKIKKVASELNGSIMEFGLRRCIQRHQEILNIADEFNSVFCAIIFAEFFVNGLQLCFLAYQLGGGNGTKLENFPFLITFFSAVSVQLIMYCYGGQRMQDEVDISVYKCYVKYTEGGNIL